MTEHECLKGEDLRDILTQLDEEAKEGWELVCSSCAHSFGVGGKTMHFLFIRREKNGDR